MRIVSLEAFMTDILRSLGCDDELVGISFDSSPSEKGAEVPRVTRPRGGAQPSGLLENFLCRDLPLLQEIKALSPDVIATSIVAGDEDGQLRPQLRTELQACLGREVTLAAHTPLRLEQILNTVEAVGNQVGKAAAGHDLAQRYKSRILDWIDNFHERTRHKKVTFLSGIKPFVLGGYWIPDMISACSAISQMTTPGEPHRTVEWQEILSFRPDVIVVAPQHLSLQESLQSFKVLEKQPDWEDLPAVKRGEVFFSDGTNYFHRPSPRIVTSMGILISAIGGLESGYIVERDTFYRLRWLEMYRHKL